MGILIMIINPLYGGVVEELYYRGYLLFRMSDPGVRASLINVILWAALIHLGQPWDILAFILAFLLLVYVVWWKKNVLVHTLGNLINVLMNGSMLFGLAIE